MACVLNPSQELEYIPLTRYEKNRMLYIICNMQYLLFINIYKAKFKKLSKCCNLVPGCLPKNMSLIDSFQS